MPNLRSAKKRMKTDTVKRLRNRKDKSTMRTYVKKTLTSIDAGDKALAEESLKKAFSSLDRSAKKGLVHKNYADRHKARLAKAVSSME